MTDSPSPGVPPRSRWFVALLAGLAFVLFVVAAASIPRLATQGREAWPDVLLVVTATSLTVLAVVALRRRDSALAAIADRDQRIARLEYESRQSAGVLQGRLADQTTGFAHLVAHLARVEVPAALAGAPLPAEEFLARVESSVRAPLEEMLSLVAEGHRRHGDELESQRLAMVTLSRRVQSAMHRVQETAARTAEDNRDDPGVYGACQQMDHLASQAARLAQSLAVLCGRWEGQQWDRPMRLAEVVQAAQARIEDFRRVKATGDPDLSVAAEALEAGIHLVAELLANAAESSPRATPVAVSVSAVPRGAVIQIDDYGAGLEEPRLSQARTVVSGAEPVSLAQVGEVPRMGLAVIGRYAAEHGFRVDLNDSPYGGLRAVVLIPARLLVASGPPGFAETPQILAAEPAGRHALSQAPPPSPTAAVDPGGVPAVEPDAGAAEGLPQRRSQRGQHRTRGSVVPRMAPAPQTPREAGAFIGGLLGDLDSGQARPGGDGDVTSDRSTT